MAQIDIKPAATPVTVRIGDMVILKTENALELYEGGGRPVLYMPRADADMSKLQRSETTTRCPYKGTANYYSIVTDDGVIADAIWTYEEPIPSAAAIAGHFAFYPNKVTIES